GKLENATVPKLIIQPIVENAIYHGLRPKGGGKIHISFEKVEKDIIIIVSDNGKGFDTEKLKNEKNSQPNTKVRLGGIGLKNVDHRIELLCGKGYGINITSVPDKGTEVRIKVRERE
ncbi:MAG: sensor histidine kinase, partial [Catonella sp.]|uniref:sensor histidine kinase n=1 Tax=Catonella sp. TaxID=2382125 RepID=UPI003F9FE39A